MVKISACPWVPPRRAARTAPPGPACLSGPMGDRPRLLTMEASSHVCSGERVSAYPSPRPSWWVLPHRAAAGTWWDTRPLTGAGTGAEGRHGGVTSVQAAGGREVMVLAAEVTGSGLMSPREELGQQQHGQAAPPCPHRGAGHG